MDCRKFRHAFLNNSLTIAGNISDLRKVNNPQPSLILFCERQKEESMTWTTPVLVEICIGLEINGYMPADGYVPPEF